MSQILAIWGGRYQTREEIESLLTEARTARFCCLNRDGTIHATPVWYRYMDGTIVIATPSRSRKVRNVRRNKNVTVLIDVGGPPVRGVMIYGTAELDDSDVVPTAITICEKYMPKDKAKDFATGVVNKGMDLIIKVKPERMTSFRF